ncbi:hypothetical protein LCGC14_1290970 [marine sediment metagenome]|uniref:Uncharacterized protein n=1 Tax=marine sediment metagenome TaxID=412755 RepID=A0A0F9N8Y3_9ZZZZ
MKTEWKGGKLTKKRALFLCWKLWEWLAKNPGKGKGGWPEWEINGGKVKNMPSDCALCQEYTLRPLDDGDKVGCKYSCLMASFWGGHCDEGDVNSGRESPFYLWLKGTSSDRSKYARRIAAAAKRRYEKL